MTTTEQMNDIYGVPCDVQHVRTFRSKFELGVGYPLREPGTWFVYDRNAATERWHMHCGPYSTFEQAKDWINGISEAPSLETRDCPPCAGSGSLPDMTCCPICGGGGKVLVRTVSR